MKSLPIQAAGLVGVVVGVWCGSARGIAGPGELPVGSHPPAIGNPHFPTPAHAVIWRNWGLIPIGDLAALLGTSGEEIGNTALEMGLPRLKEVSDIFRHRGYITLIRRNWHLLPYSQLVQVLNITSDDLAFILREDDFLFVKLGNLKPRSPLVTFPGRDGKIKEGEAWIRSVIQKHFPEGVRLWEEPRFAFVDQLSRLPDSWSSPSKPPERPGDDGLRLIYSYFATYGDPLKDPSLDPYPDGLLARLSELGVNGVWLHAVLRNLAPGGDDFPEFGQDHELRLAQLRRLTERAKRFGIGIYLYINEPRAMPRDFFKNRPEVAGVTEGDYVAMCTSHESVRSWMKSALEYIFREVPDLAGVFTITASENLTNCASHGRRRECPRCRERSDDEIIAEVNRVIAEGVHAGNPHARVVVWDWGWHGHQDATSLIALLPRDVWLMSVSEWAQPFERGGIAGRVGEYSLSVPGPGPRAQKHWEVAKAHGLKTVAKVQFNVTWEIAAVPYLPVLDLVAQHCFALNRANIDGIMLTWTLGGYPSPNLAVAKYFAEHKGGTIEEALTAIAAARYGEAAVPGVRRAWTTFSRAFEEYPYDIRVVYTGPQQLGPANLLYLQPTGYQATMTGFPYDDLESWRGPYPREVFLGQWEKLVQTWRQALTELAAAMAMVPPDRRSIAEADLRIAEAAYCHFASVRNQVEFVMLRDRWLMAQGASKRELGEKLKAVVRDEIEVAKRLYHLALVDSRLGFEATNHYFYLPLDLVEKVISCEKILRTLEESQ